MARIAAILGAGTIGAGWAARFLLMGWDMRVFDPDPAARARVEATVTRARASLPALYDVALPGAGTLSFHGTVSGAVAGAEWIQESVPDRLELKRKLYQRVQETCAADAIIAASTAHFAAAELQGCATRGAQILVAHPGDPVYLIPLVELGTGPDTPADLAERAVAILESVGMAPRRAGAGAAGPLADRLRESLWREAERLAGEVGATPAELDDAVTLGLGPGWAAAGPFQASRLATDGAAPAEAALARDGTLVALLRSLKLRGAGAGAVLAAHEAALAPRVPPMDRPPVTLDRQVPSDWVDYNGHMNEARYLTAFSDATDRLLLWAGMDAACIAEGHSVFTVETHIRHLGEVDIGDRIAVTTRVLEGAGKRLHLWHEMFVSESLVATGEQLLLHVDLTTRRVALPRADVGAFLTRAAELQAGLPVPEGLGRSVGAPRG